MGGSASSDGGNDTATTTVQPYCDKGNLTKHIEYHIPCTKPQDDCPKPSSGPGVINIITMPSSIPVSAHGITANVPAPLQGASLQYVKEKK